MEDQPQADVCATQLRDVFGRIELLMRRSRVNTDMSTSQASLLRTLDQHGSMRVTELARRERVRVPTASNAVSVLEDLGLAARLPAHDDRRAVIVAVTPEGRMAIRRYREEQATRLSTTIAELPDSERRSLADALLPLHSLLELLEHEDGAARRAAATSSETTARAS